MFQKENLPEGLLCIFKKPIYTSRPTFRIDPLPRSL